MRGKTIYTWLPRWLSIQGARKRDLRCSFLPPTNMLTSMSAVWQVLSGGRRVLHPRPTRTYQGT